MSRADYIGITATESSVKDEPPTAPPLPVHDLNDGQLRDMAAVGGAKVINAKDWKNESLAERDAHLRRIKETLPAGASLILTVPKGEVWVIPARGDDPGLSAEMKAILARLIGSIRNWTEAQILALPWDVMRGDPISQSDKRGSNGERVVVAPRREP
jgi:hypothetical protein